MAKAKRKPGRKPKRGSKRRPVKAKTKIRKDPLKEYDEAIQKDGIVEVLKLTDDDCLANVKLHVSTQSLELDRLLNGQGIPTGRVTEIFGTPHIGKSTLLDHIFAQVQKMGGVAILADTEGARDVTYTRSIGVDPAKLRYLEFPKKRFKVKGEWHEEEQLHIENVLTKIYETIEWWKQNAPEMPVVIGWDALGATATRDEVKKRLEEDAKVAAAASVMRRACRQIPGKLGNSNVAVVVCNHEYTNIKTGQGAGRPGKKKETYGGEAIRHLASIRLSLYPVGEWVTGPGGKVLGRVVGAKLIKNRLGNPFGDVRFALLSGIGIDNVWSIFQKLKASKIIQSSGSWAAINLDGEVLKFQGWHGLLEKCREDSTLFPRLVSVYRSLV